MTTPYDKGPTQKIQAILEAVPTASFAQFKNDLWFDWGPVFYRGRLDKSAKVLVIASDPGPTERIVGRTLVGDAGQRVQGFLSKLGLKKRYVCLNASPYAIHPSSTNDDAIINEPAIKAWRNKLFNAVVGSKLKAVIAFGGNAKTALAGWKVPRGVMVQQLRHPSAQPDALTLAEWAPAITALRGVVTRDPGGNANGPNYGSAFVPGDWAPIPADDMPFGAPPWLGDDTVNRAKNPPRYNCCWRDPQDMARKMIWEVGT